MLIHPTVLSHYRFYVIAHCLLITLSYYQWCRRWLQRGSNCGIKFSSPAVACHLYVPRRTFAARRRKRRAVWVQRTHRERSADVVTLRYIVIRTLCLCANTALNISTNVFVCFVSILIYLYDVSTQLQCITNALCIFITWMLSEIPCVSLPVQSHQVREHLKHFVCRIVVI